MKLLPLAVLAALLAAGSAQAQTKAAPAPGTPSPPPAAQGAPQPNMPDPLTKDFRACMQKLQESAQAAKAQQPDAAAALVCFTAENKRQEAKLSAGMARASKVLKPADQKRLEDANVAWRRFRDADCLFLADPKGTANEAAGNAQCVLDRTIRRAVDVEGLAASVESSGGGGGAAPPPTPAAPAK